MPELGFQILGVEAVARALSPLFHFKLRVKTTSENEAVEALILQAQIQIQAPQRSYSSVEREKLVELFGQPDQWQRTLRNRLWGHAHTTSSGFIHQTELILAVPCTFDLNIAATKYFFALSGGEVSLLFLFSGTVFYLAEGGRLQVQRLSWDKECQFALPVAVWESLMEQHYPNSAWLLLQRDVFERLYAYKRRNGYPSWEQVMEELLSKEAGQFNQTRCQPEAVGS
jgi:hypothetical protein